jgi:hypothetical protein
MGKIDYIKNDFEILDNKEYLKIIKYIDNIKKDTEFKYFFSQMNDEQKLKTYYILYYFIIKNDDEIYKTFNIDKSNWIRNYECFCLCTRLSATNKNYFVYYKNTYKMTLKEKIQSLL